MSQPFNLKGVNDASPHSINGAVRRFSVVRLLVGGSKTPCQPKLLKLGGEDSPHQHERAAFQNTHFDTVGVSGLSPPNLGGGPSSPIFRELELARHCVERLHHDSRKAFHSPTPQKAESRRSLREGAQAGTGTTGLEAPEFLQRETQG